MKDNKLLHWLDNRIYIIALGIMTIIIWIYQPVLGILALLATAYLIYYAYTETEKKNREVNKYIELLSEDFETAAKHAIFNMPFPLVIIDERGGITWYNTPFLDMIIEEDILNERIYDLVPGINMEELLKGGENKPRRIDYDNKSYLVYPNYVDSRKTTSANNRLIMLYWVEYSAYFELEKRYKDEQAIVSLIYIDNFDDVKNNTPDIHRPLLIAEIDKRINEYFMQYGGLVRKYENDKYLVLLNHKGLEHIQEKKFDILDEIRDLNIGNTMPITLSIGVSATSEDLIQSHDNAKSAIEIALGRGGDQAVLNKEGAYEFYGGKTKALEKRNKVRARVIGHALRRLVDESDNVFVMGHKNPDMDSIGSSIGVLRGVKNRGKMGYIILNGENPSITNICAKMKEEQPEIKDLIISSEEAKNLINENSLMILVDNHKPSFTEAPELLDLITKVVIIDHHRRGAEFVKDPVLTYLEPYASSTSELVTEILSYMSDDINLTKFEAEALLSGITVDTNNFSYQTGVRTFEAASILKRAGADTIAVRQLFRDDHDTFVYKAEVIRSSKIIFDNIAIGRLEEDIANGLLIAAQSSNELLDIKGVKASFVLTYSNDRVHISGRSLGDISVQLILEALGGGGHFNVAGAQIMGVSMDKAEEMLIEEIRKYLKEGE
ncbi:MAG: DHH family phosphoesterase [Tissierellaceae bacterium]|jgi:c-di-AMP phosphodiesterase-like protein|nr:phosphoesterase [Tissierellia bacterium]